jgi:hypothetical protein
LSASLFVFRTATIDSNSVTEDNSGTNLDFFAVSTDRLTSVSAIEDKIVLYFRESNTFENSSANQAKVTLDVTEDNEYNTVVNIWKLTLQEDQIFSFDNVNSQYPLSTITGVDTIIRVTSERFTSGGGLPSGGDQYQTLVKQSATDGDAAWEYPDTLLLLVRNVSGGLLAKGTPVHANGVTGVVPDVIAADASIPAAMPATYVLLEDTANNAEGLAMITGIIENVDTSAFSPGDVIYVASGGGYTNVKPTGTDLIQNLGVVTKSNASTGSGVVYGTGRSNDVPNLPTGKFFIGSATNTTESAYTFPTADGTANQILQTDGLGTVSFVDETDTTYTAGDGLRLVGTEFSVLPKTNGGLVFESAALAVDLGATAITGTLGIGDGGTGQTTQQAALDAITNATSGTTGQVLTTDGTNASWQDASGGGGYKLVQTYSYSDTGTTDKFFVQNAITELSGTNAARDYRSAFAIPVAGSIGDCTMMGGSAVNGNAYRLYAWIDNTSTYYSEATGGDLAGGRYTVRWTAWKNVSDDSDAPDPSFSANAYLAFQLVPTGTLANPGSVSLPSFLNHSY